MPKLYIDTDHLRDTRQLQRQLEERCVPTPDGCLLYPETSIMVRTRDGFHATSPARVAWALAHPEDHLGPRDLAVHRCIFGTNHKDGHGDPRVCCNPAHIKKGDHTDVVVMKKARARRLVLQGGTL